MEGLRLLVGLGNPGPRYAGTRHNLGFLWVDKLAREDGAQWREFGELGEVARSGSRPELWFARPLTFMNLSGRMLSSLCRKRGLRPQEMLVGIDDMSLPLGQIRLRSSGSSGGHNGLQSILEELGTRDIPRLRLGIGPPPPGADPAAFVLSRFLADEKPLAQAMLERAVEAAQAALEEGLASAMTRFNAR